MSYKQLKNFNRSNAGTKLYWCLRNVRMGYGIAPKYADAWQAWQNSPQRTGAIPKGVNVPVYFSFKYTIDGIYKNWGHIAVRLADGRVWTDGRYYSSVQSLVNNYLSNGKYVGWSEEVNGVQVIKKESNMPTLTNDQDLDYIYLDALGRTRSGNEGEDVYKNKDYRFVHRDVRSSDEADRYRKREVAQDAARVAQGKTISLLRSQIDSLKKSSNKDELRTALGKISQLASELEVSQNKLEDAQAKLEDARDNQGVDENTAVLNFFQKVINFFSKGE